MKMDPANLKETYTAFVKELKTRHPDLAVSRLALILRKTRLISDDHTVHPRR